MASENAKRVAHEVIKTVSNGKKVNKKKIQEKNGYSSSSAKSYKAMETKTYKDAITPFANKLETERQRIINNIGKRKLDKVEYKKLIDSIDVLTKNIQLLSSKETEKSGLTIQVIDYQKNEQRKAENQN